MAETTCWEQSPSKDSKLFLDILRYYKEYIKAITLWPNLAKKVFSGLQIFQND